MNYYQRFGVVPPWGDSVVDANVNVNVTDAGWGFLLAHITITNHANAQNGIHGPLVGSRLASNEPELGAERARTR